MSGKHLTASGSASTDVDSTTTQSDTPAVPQSNINKMLELPISQQAAVLSHRIKRQCKTPASAMKMMREHISSNTNNDAGSSLDWEEAWFATLQVCGKARDYQLTLQIVQEHCRQSDRCLSIAITICGRCNQIQAALSLLRRQQQETITTPAPFNSAIAACGTNRAWEDALRIVKEEMPRAFVTGLTCNAVMTALVKSHKGGEALDFLRKGFEELGVTRDRNSYHHAMAALMAQGSFDDAVQLVLKDMKEESKTNPEATPNKDTYDRLISTMMGRRQALAKDLEEKEEGDPDYEALLQKLDNYNNMLHQLQQAALEVNDDTTNNKKKKKRKLTDEAQSSLLPTDGKRAKYAAPVDSSNGSSDPRALLKVWDFCKWELPKRGKGKTACWQLGIIQDQTDNNDDTIMVGLHPNRNPSKNGIQLWFFRDSKDGGKLEKLGYLLMINTPDFDSGTADTAPNSTSGTSQLLGLRVTDDDRRKGLAKTFVAVWLQCCLDANLSPTTGKMNKPLLCLVLQHSFHFTPIEQSGGVRAKLLPPPENDDTGDNDVDKPGVVRLTTASSAVKNLAGALSPRDIQEQNIQLVAPSSITEREHKKGRPVDVGALLQAPSREELQDSILRVLQERWKLSPGVLTVYSSGPAPTNKDDRPLTMSRLFLGI